MDTNFFEHLRVTVTTDVMGDVPRWGLVPLRTDWIVDIFVFVKVCAAILNWLTPNVKRNNYFNKTCSLVHETNIQAAGDN